MESIKTEIIAMVIEITDRRMLELIHRFLCRIRNR